MSAAKKLFKASQAYMSIFRNRKFTSVLEEFKIAEGSRGQYQRLHGDSKSLLSASQACSTWIQARSVEGDANKVNFVVVLVQGIPKSYSGDESIKLLEIKNFPVSSEQPDTVPQTFWTTIVQEWEKATGKSIDDCKK
ncbi:hypothetical protein BV25DRAFT_1821258 [Artomyces pyxidatus]|uniref:Uncharacterized protein n=1 Tax=Artomyces pyxidatus TaxID=48021 RepID=A0ACB8TBQ2_9AGAM|nr:hypothetical protein BV25DRAFT_1821258 [Artomyces pyxidatus]